MKKIFTILLTVFSCSLVNASNQFITENNDSQKINIHIINKNIGPIKGGDFLEDQKFFVENSYGKNPSSGLFNIPNGRNHKECYPLGNLIPDFSISKKKEIKQAFRGNPLGLPGERHYQVIPWGLNNDIAGKISIFPSLITYKYGFTTKGWASLEEVDLIKKGTKLKLNLNGKSRDITIEYSWPVTVKTNNPRPIYIDVEAYVGKPQFRWEKIEFERNWIIKGIDFHGGHGEHNDNPPRGYKQPSDEISEYEKFINLTNVSKEDFKRVGDHILKVRWHSKY